MARRKVKVAIVGSGLAGLTAAYLLANVDQDEVEFEVHVFEKVCRFTEHKAYEKFYNFISLEKKM